MTLNRAMLIVVISLCILTAPYVYAADILNQIHPYIGVKGEYSDNLNLTTENQKKDFYTTISPGIKFSNMDAQSGITMDANAGAVLYNDYTNLNYWSGNVNIDSKYMTSSHFNFYLRDAFIRSDDPRESEYFTTTADNKYVLATQTQRAVYLRNVVEPTVEYQFGPESRIGVKYRNNLYHSVDIQNNDSIENYVSPFLTFWFNHQHGISLNYEYTNGDFEADPDLNGHRINGSYMFRFNPKATVSLNGAYTTQKFTSGFSNYDIYETSLGISYLFSTTLSASAKVGYYWQNPEIGENTNGFMLNADIAQHEGRNTYVLSVQGGYTQDFFTSQNLGFKKYYRATGSITHFLDRNFSIGCLGNIERTESVYDLGERDTLFGVGANLSYLPLKWLNFSLEYKYNQRNTNYQYEVNEYKENRGMFTVTATY